MHFTQEDYIKIENWLHRNSVKDTEFQEALPFTGKEIVTVVQDGHNRKVNIQEFINQLYKHGVEDFLNVTNTYRANNITLKEAISLIPSEARKEGQVITFLNTEGNWEIYQFIGKLNQWNNTTLWNNPFDWEKFVVDSILPDEEDLTKSEPDAKGNSYLSLKDRKYEPDKYSGLGRKILRRRVVEIEDPIYGIQEKNLLLQADFAEDNTVYVVRYDFTLNGQDITLPDNSYIEYEGGSISDGNIIDRVGGLSIVVLKKNIVNGKNILTQDMISKPNTIYEIRHDFDLNGEEITIPEGCVLDFQGGSLSNGTIVGNGTNIKASCYVIFDNVIIEGVWEINNIFLDWFNVDDTEGADNYNSIRNCFQLSNDNIYNNIYLPKKTLYFSTRAHKDVTLGGIVNIGQFVIKSNTTVHLESTIILNPHKLTHTEIFSSTNTKNISIIGSGKIVGDVETHLGTTGEWCHGIHFDGVKNALIEGVTIEKNWGDGISLDSSAEVNSDGDLEYSCENILIRNVKSFYNRRQGLSIEAASNIEVCYSEFAYTGKINGTSPMAGIDIEPWRTNDTNKNIHVHHCNIHDNTNQNIVIYSANRNTENIIIEDIRASASEYAIKADNVIFRNVNNVSRILLQYVNNVFISNIELELIHFASPADNGNVTIENCKFNLDYDIGTYYKGFINLNSWQANINKLTVNNCEFIKGSNAPSTFDLLTKNSSANIIFKNSYIDLKDTPINLSCSFHNCHIKASKSDTTINAAMTYEYFNNILEFSEPGYDILYRTNPSITSETFKDIEILRFIGNIFTNKLSTKTIHFNSYVPWTNCKMTIEGNNIAGNGALGYIPTIVSNASIINNIERNAGDSSSRPTSAVNGFAYYDTTLNKPIWWTGTKWVDATGQEV